MSTINTGEHESRIRNSPYQILICDSSRENKIEFIPKQFGFCNIDLLGLTVVNNIYENEVNFRLMNLLFIMFCVETQQ